MKLLPLVGCLLIIAGCASEENSLKQRISNYKHSLKNEVELPVPFNPEDAAFIFNKGTATVKGKGVFKANTGQVISCDGSNVHLVPVTEYSKERYTYLVGGTNEGFISQELIQTIEFTPDPPEYREYMRSTRCNYKGEFLFENVADGEYYLNTDIFSPVNGYRAVKGGVFAARIVVKSGEVIHVDLD